MLRILIADDHDLIRHGIKQLLVSRPGWEICSEASNGLEAVSAAQTSKPDIAILDISMPRLSGLEAARKICQESPDTEILILSMYSSDEVIREIVDAGAKGYILKSDSDRDLIMAVETIARHKPFFTSYAAELLLTRFKEGKSAFDDASHDRLTPREREVVRLLADGKSSKEVASSLSISVKTADTHRTNIMRKLQVHTIADLVRYAVRNQIVET